MKPPPTQLYQQVLILLGFIGSVLVYVPPHPINFVHDHLFFSKFIIIYFCYLGLG